MATKVKDKYSVYYRLCVYAEDPENTIVHPWTFGGDTYAVSEAKAINNVRFRIIGEASQYLPIATSGHFDTFMEWKAELFRNTKAVKPKLQELPKETNDQLEIW